MSSLPTLRSDLDISRRKDGCWLVSDPVAGTFFLFSEAELSLAQALNDAVAVEDWVENWNVQNRSKSLEPAMAERFLDQLIRDQLVGVPVPGYGVRLHWAELQQGKSSSVLKNPLAIRLPGFNPASILSVLSPIFGWLFRPVVMVCVTIVLMFVFGAVLLATEQRPGFASLGWLATVPGVFAFACVFVGVKVLHELGHAIAATVHQARCRQIGVLLLFLMPTLYCDVSDAWKLENRWQRIAISAAGIYVELILALVAAIGWALTAPGPLNGIMFQVMLLCSISTVLINGNPLLRYDGYYVMSDLLNQPNLNSAAQVEWQRLIAGDRSWRTFKTARWSLVAFRMSSFVYRLFVIASIVVTVVCVATEYSLGLFGWAIAVVLASLFGRNLMGRPVAAMSKSKGMSGLVTASVVVAAIWFAVCVPLPRWVYLKFQVHPLNTQTIYATVDGNVDECLQQNPWVFVNSPIVTINNSDLDFKTSAAEIEVRRSENEVAQLERRCRIQPELNELLAIAIEQKNAAIVRLGNFRRQMRELKLHSAVSGRVESLLAVRNPASRHHSQVFRGQPIAQVIDGSKKQIRLMVDEGEIDLLKPGQEVCFRSNDSSHPLGSGAVGQLLRGQWDFAQWNQRASDLEDRPKTFVATVGTEADLAAVSVYSGGTARVRIASATLADQISDLLRRTFQYR